MTFAAAVSVMAAAVAVVVVAAPASASTQEDAPAPAPLSERHREWLQDEVVYIISEIERDSFRALPSNEDRDTFIDVFWRMRDATPGTARNESREEHAERIAHANRYLGRETPRQGWQTDRGRIYIQLGPPSETQSWPDPKAFWPLELWFYRLDPQESGLPPYIYLLFFRPEQGREYRLYDPLADGPTALAKQMSLQLAQPQEIVQHLLQSIGHEVAIASVNMDAGENFTFRNPRASAGNAIVARNIQEAPYRGVNTSYARRFLLSGGATEVAVAFNTLPIGMTALGLWDERGLPFLHYAIQVPPERVLIGQYEHDYYVGLDVGVRLTDLRGTDVVDTREDIEQHFDETRAQQVVRSPLAFYDRVDVIPGIYDLAVTFTNGVNGDHGLGKTRTLIPDTRPGVWSFSDVLLAMRAVPLEGPARLEGPKAFRLGGLQYVPAVDDMFVPGAQMHVYAQLGSPEGFTGDAEVAVRVSIVNPDGEEMLSVHGLPVQAPPAPVPTALAAQISLVGIPEGSYTLRIEATLPGDAVMSRERPFVVSSSAQGVTPEILLGREAPPGSVDEYVLRGAQHLERGELQAAETYFRNGLESAPESTAARRRLGALLAGEGKDAEAVDVLRPIARGSDATPDDFVQLSSVLRGAGLADEAVTTMRVGVQRWRRSASSHAELGRALLAAGLQDEAVEALAESLRLQPEQPEIEELLAGLRGGGL